MPLSVNEIQERKTTAMAAAGKFYGMYKRCYELCAPNQNQYTSSAGQNKSPNVRDSIGAVLTDSYVRTLVNNLTPANLDFFLLKAGVGMAKRIAQINGMQDISPEDLADIEESLNLKLQQVTKDIFSFIHASNFAAQITSFFYDCAIGTGMMLVQPGNTRLGLGSPLNFRTVSPRDVGLEEGCYGEISGIFRQLKIKGRNAKHEWPDWEGETPDAESQEDVDIDEVTVLNYDTYQWEYYILWNDNIKLVRYYKTCPWVIYRHEVIPGEIWGRGPIIKALPDLEQINVMEDMQMRNAQLTTYGAYMVLSDDIMNPGSLKIFPGAMIPVKRNGGPSGPSIAPLPNVGNLQAHYFSSDRVAEKLKRFMLDEYIPERPNMTATEALERIRQTQRMLGASVGRIQYELLQPLAQRVIDILGESGLINLPEEFSKVDNFTLKLQIISPIAKIQSLNEIESVVQTLQMLGSISPELIPLQVKLNELGRFFANKTGADLSLFKTQEEIAVEQQQMAQQQQVMQLMAMQQQQQQSA